MAGSLLLYEVWELIRAQLLTGSTPSQNQRTPCQADCGEQPSFNSRLQACKEGRDPDGSSRAAIKRWVSGNRKWGRVLEGSGASGMKQFVESPRQTLGPQRWFEVDALLLVTENSSSQAADRKMNLSILISRLICVLI